MPFEHGQLDITDTPDPRSDGTAAGRPSIQVWFECAGLYQRVFRAVAGDCYLARCAKCGKTMRFDVGSGGTNQRTFRVRC